MIRLWIKFKEEAGSRVVDKATFQSFGCETAIAVASLATEMIRGKTSEEIMAIKAEELAPGTGPIAARQNSLHATCRKRAALGFAARVSGRSPRRRRHRNRPPTLQRSWISSRKRRRRRQVEGGLPQAGGVASSL